MPGLQLQGFESGAAWGHWATFVTSWLFNSFTRAISTTSVDFLKQYEISLFINTKEIAFFGYFETFFTLFYSLQSASVVFQSDHGYIMVLSTLICLAK